MWRVANGLDNAALEPTACQTIMYLHPDSPNYGSHWSQELISFDQVKLTNKTNGKGNVHLNSLHMYEPEIHIGEVEIGAGVQTLKILKVFTFPPTQFIAVTAYQVQFVTFFNFTLGSIMSFKFPYPQGLCS